MSNPKLDTLFLTSEYPEYPADLIADAPLSGPFDSYLEFILNSYHIESDPKMIRKFLKENGGWSTEELENDEKNIGRFLWVTILNRKEEETENEKLN